MIEMRYLDNAKYFLRKTGNCLNRNKRGGRVLYAFVLITHVLSSKIGSMCCKAYGKKMIWKDSLKSLLSSGFVGGVCFGG